MLNQYQRTDVKKTNHVIHDFLLERKQLMVLYTGILQQLLKENTAQADDMEIDALEPDPYLELEESEVQQELLKAKQQQDDLNDFCRILVDYASVGHFELFESISKTSDALQARGIELDRALIEEIFRTTIAMVNFSDKYAGKLVTEVDLDELIKDLSDVGESIAVRVDSEDRLIMIYDQSIQLAANDPDDEPPRKKRKLH